jgi:hypothetical protein
MSGMTEGAMAEMETRGLPGHGAAGPHPELAEKLMLFGQFVGSWDVDVTWLQDGRVTRRATGEWHFGWVLEGRAVQDVWIVPTRAERAAGAPPYEYGTSLRFYDPRIDAWRSTWIGPVNGLVVPFIARQDGDDIVLEGRRPEGWPIRWWFSDVTRDSFRWRNAVSRDDGQTWETVQEMRGRRQGQIGVARTE